MARKATEIEINKIKRLYKNGCSVLDISLEFNRSEGFVRKHVKGIKKAKKVNKLDLIGKRSGKLEVVEYVGKKEGYDYYKCKCDCGNEILVVRGSLLQKKTKSCGCLIKEKSVRNEFVPKLDTTTVNIAKVTTYKLNQNELQAYLENLKIKEVEYKGTREL